jgi:ABC-type Mn2+/Zn2+ transport system permease subunit
MGALLAGALVIMPAATGRRCASDISHFLVASCVASVLTVASGLMITQLVLPQFSLGPTIVIISALLFAVSLLKKPA